MPVTIELDWNTEVTLEDEAERRGITLAELIVECTKESVRYLPPHVSEREWMYDDERHSPRYDAQRAKVAAFLAWSSTHPTDTPVVPMEMLRREHLYSGE